MGFEERGKALEDAFYAKKNKELLDQVRATMDAKTNRDALKAAAGISDEEVLDRIFAIGVNAESLAAMAIAPMVLVAWADGNINDKERAAIVSGAEKSGIKPDSMAGQLLDGWLEERPDDSLLDVWTEYTLALCGQLHAGDQIKMSDQVLGRCKTVAEAAGGFLGLGSISAQEQAILSKLAAAFKS